MKASDRGRNVKKVKNFLVVSMKFLLLCLIQPNEIFLSSFQVLFDKIASTYLFENIFIL